MLDGIMESRAWLRNIYRKINPEGWCREEAIVIAANYNLQLSVKLIQTDVNTTLEVSKHGGCRIEDTMGVALIPLWNQIVHEKIELI